MAASNSDCNMKRTHPVVISLRFKTEEEKDVFLGQLSDGFGENFVDIVPTTGAEFAIADDFSLTIHDFEP